jgi:putative PIN family toxin of toxin-antitoxin system
VKAVLDTNVVMSGVFFGGVPGRILSAWRTGRFQLVLSASIVAEYREVAAELTSRYGGSEFELFAGLLLMKSEVVDAPEFFPVPVCSDPDDDKFLACAQASMAPVIVSGDRHLLAVSGWRGIEVLRPRTFLDRHLGAPEVGR